MSLFAQTDALLVTLLVAAVYLVLLRLVDLNEREPLWSVLLLFALGIAAAALLRLFVGSPVLELTLLPGAAASQLAVFAAIAVGVAVLEGAARVRGWSELNGVMDGIVYGAAAGLGFATGETLLRLLQAKGGILAGLSPGLFDSVWSCALSGVAGGLFGGLVGAGFGAASQAHASAKRFALPIVGLGAAVAADAAFRVLAHGDALGGSAALLRVWAALLLPLVLAASVAVYALLQERRAIHGELASERWTGAVSDADLALLESWRRRQRAYLRVLGSGNLARAMRLMTLHNRQVQLALTKRNEAGEGHPARRAALQSEVERLRAAALDAKRSLGQLSGPGLA
jgi:RsiW-degrading membrane proteinase PrsW (M82 family)